ncbi:hypothetical protein D3C76_1000940 [compost metagenome]
MRRAPPDFRRQVVAGLAQRFDRGGKQQRLAHRDRFGLEALLACLGPEGAEVRWNHHPGDYLDISFFERGDLRREIVGQALEATGIDQLKTLLRQHRWEAELLVAPGIAVAIIGKQAADHFVRRHRAPHRTVGADHIFKAPEKVVGPLEALIRLATPGEKPRLPWRHRGDARNLVDFALIGHGIGGFRG